MKILAAFICLAGFVLFAGQTAEAPAKHWETFVLWSNSVLSANLRYMRAPSVADEDYMFVEFDNHTDKPLDLSQAWLGLPGTETDLATHKSVFMSDMAVGVIYNGMLPPGKTKAAQHGVFEGGLDNLGLTPEKGFHVELTPRANVMLENGTRFSTADDKRTVSLEFHYPNPVEMAALKVRFKNLLAHPDNQFASGYYLDALAKMPEVSDSTTFDELFSAVKSHSWVDGKAAIMATLGRRFPNAPALIPYFVNQLSRPDGDSFFSFPREIWQNPVFVEPLVKRYETYGTDISELRETRKAWITNRQAVARLEAALLRRHPVLARNVAEISGTNLCDWSGAVADAGVTGGTNVLPRLASALDDRRIIPDCRKPFDSRAKLPWQPRVCDAAAEAILISLDGSLGPAFEKTSLPFRRTKEEDYAAHDQVVAELKNRLRLKTP